jgi:hypothetical protein
MADETKRRQRKAERLKAESIKINERLRVCYQARKGLSDLIRLAEAGDELSVMPLVGAALETVSTLNSIAKRRPELVYPVSRNTFCWPALISRKRALTQANKKLMDTLQLGRGGIYSEREWQISAPSTYFALMLFGMGQLRAAAGRFPHFTRKTKKQWFEKNWNALLKEGFKPEESALLAPLGKSKATKTPKYGFYFHKRSRDANVRSEIKRKVWKAFDKIFEPRK